MIKNANTIAKPAVRREYQKPSESFVFAGAERCRESEPSMANMEFLTRGARVPYVGTKVIYTLETISCQCDVVRPTVRFAVARLVFAPQLTLPPRAVTVCPVRSSSS